MDVETDTKTLSFDSNWGTFYSPLKTFRYFNQRDERYESKQCIAANPVTLCFMATVSWVSSWGFVSSPVRCCGSLCCTSLLCLLAMSMGWGQLVDKDLAAASIQLKAGRIGWLFHGIAILLHHTRPSSSLVYSIFVELIPAYSDAGKPWPLQLISNCNPKRRMVG